LRLTRQADRFGGRNPLRVNFHMDEFCTIGVLPDFKDRIATMRSRGINCMMVAQSLSQLKERYPKEVWKEIIGCCALRLIWDAAEKETAEYASSLLRM
jgi:type IV secretion system protein VirD4